MKLEFLWDEEKTRKLFKSHLILFFVGGIVASLYALLLPSSTPFKVMVTAIPIIFTLSCPGFLFLLPKPNPGLRFLLFTLESQLAAAIFMAVTGGFLGIVQFAPYMFLLFAVFELGTVSTIILGIFSLTTFLGVMLWNLSTQADANILQNAFYYIGSYILILLIERNIGKELSLQFEAKRKLEQVDSLKNQFLSLTSHYLRTPLTVIKSFVYELKESPMNENQKVQLQQVEVNVSNLENLIEKMLTITSIEKGQAKVSLIPEDLNRMLSAIIMEYQLQAHTQHLSLIYQPPPSPLPQFAFDSVKLKEAISSLIDNAIKYNHLGGLVTVSTAADNKQIVIRVADNGQGIKADHLKNLFTPFNRGEMSEVLNFDKPGIGLSLYLAKLIIEAHGGRISAQSAEGKGSVFTVVLPIKSSKNLVQA